MIIGMKIRHYLLLGAAALALIAGFFLPNAVAGVMDGRRFDNLTMIDSQSISFDAAPELGLFGRLTIVANSNTEVLPLKSGNVMDPDAASERVVKELKRFSENKALRLDYSKYVLEESEALLVVDSLIPTHSLIVWQMTLADPSGDAVTVVIDDETGVILRLVQRRLSAVDFVIASKSPEPTDEELYAAAQSLTEMMTVYYGFAVLLADYEYSGSLSYYKAEITDGWFVIPMYGVVRATGFTMNERVWR